MTNDVDRSRGDRRGRRARVVAGVGAAMLVAAAGGLGFGIGRSLDDDGSPDADVIVPATEPSTTEVTTAAQEPVADTVPAVEEVAPADGDEPATTGTPAADQPAEGGVVAAEVDGAPNASGSPGWSAFNEPEMELLVERTTTDGMTVRVHLGEIWENLEASGYPGGWQPPGWCFENGQARVAIAGGSPAVIDVGGVAWYSEPYLGRSVSWLTLGRSDGNPHRIVFVQVPGDTTNVTATWGDGSTDEMAPQNGVAVLVAPGTPNTIEHDDGHHVWLEEQPDFTVTFVSGSGPVTVDDDGIGTWSDPEFVRSCSPPPPELPEPGEQPADPAAAEAEILGVIDLLYGLDDGEADVADLVDDPTGVAEAQAQVADGDYADAIASLVVEVEELVFTEPGEAWFRYRIETDITNLYDRYGIAVFVDGVWKLTRATICQDVGMAGASCGLPTVAPVHPPGY